jgi:4-hydroxybenzoate polyprenyltransferase
MLAGADPTTAIRLGVAMTALQLGIGALNDVVDAPRDAGRKPGKPIPAGLVSGDAGLAAALVAFGIGLILTAPGGPPMIGLALVVIGIGLAYDLALKGTAWSWLPFAVGIPVLPVFGWVGATGVLTPLFAVIVPAAVAAGAALAIANSLVDVERDRGAAASSVAVALGEGRAQAAGIVLLVVIAVVAATSSSAFGAMPLAAAIVGLVGCVPVVAAWLARNRDTDRRELGWRAQAIGLGFLAVAWFGAVPR